MRRLLVLVALVAALAGGLVLDRDRAVPAVGGPPLGRPADMPTATADDALSSTWYCPGLPAPADGTATGSLAILNPGTVERSGSATFVFSPTGDGPAPDPVSVPLTLPPGLTTVALAEVLGDRRAPFVAAVVEVAGGGLAVEQVTITPDQGPGGFGESTAPCSSRASDRWYFADGATTVDARLRLLAFNPFPDDAVVDFAFNTDQGRRDRIPGLTGVVVPAGTLRVVALGDEGAGVLRARFVSTEARVRSGRIVLGRWQTFDGSGDRPKGLVTGPGAPSAGTAWWFAAGEQVEGLADRLVIANPGTADADVDITVYPLQDALGTGGGVVVPVTTAAAPGGTSATTSVPIVTSVLGDATLGATTIPNAPDQTTTGPATAAPVTTVPVTTVPATTVPANGPGQRVRVQTPTSIAGTGDTTVPAGTTPGGTTGDVTTVPAGTAPDGTTVDDTAPDGTAVDGTAVEDGAPLDTGIVAEPIQRSVPGGATVFVQLDDATVAPGSFGIAVVSVNGVPVVVERASDQRAPLTASGVTFTPGARVTAGRWLVPVARTDAGRDAALSILNPGDTAVTVTVEQVGSGGPSVLADLDAVEVGPGELARIPLAAIVPGEPSVPLVVRADRPIVVERTLVGATIGLTRSAAVPVSGS